MTGEIHKPFGEIFLNLETNPNSDIPNFFYTGKRLDKDTGLYYYGARYYDPTIGRFTQADTIIPNPSNPQSFNRYSYTDNNPINYTDPTGHGKWFREWGGKIVGAIVGVATFIVTGGNLQLAMMAYSFTSTAIDGYNAGLSIGRSIGLAAASAAASYMGGQIGSAFGNWLGGSSKALGAFYGDVFGGAFAGAAGGAAGAAVTGGDIGQAAGTGAAFGAGMGAVSGIFKANAVAKQQRALAQAQRINNMRALGVDRNAIASATRGMQAAENGIADSIAGELGGGKTFSLGGVYDDTKLRLTSQLNSTQPAIGYGSGIDIPSINWQHVGSVIGRGAEWTAWGAGYAFNMWKGPAITPTQLYPPPPGVDSEQWYSVDYTT